jgi:hypothetical protein
MTDTSWPQLLSAIEDAEAGRGAARLTETCLSAYSALAAAQFQITLLRARAQRIEVEVDVRVVHGIRSHGCQDDAAACARR